MMDKLTKSASGHPNMFAELVKKCRGKTDLPFPTVHHLVKVGILTPSGGLENATTNVVMAASAGPDSNPPPASQQLCHTVNAYEKTSEALQVVLAGSG
ncbi:MAG: hypothetical protein K2X93_26340 [Candidatus Obscuribacterales bacterium]|nr:hypothetical protein [Candidatus Obscuribacterales bacterium]